MTIDKKVAVMVVETVKVTGHIESDSSLCEHCMSVIVANAASCCGSHCATAVHCSEHCHPGGIICAKISLANNLCAKNKVSE